MNKIKGRNSKFKGQIIDNISVKDLLSKSIKSFTFYALPFTFLLFTFCLMPSSVFAQQQDDEPPADVEPPPVKKLSQEEKSSLAAETGVKKRTQISLELMDARLANSEKLTAAGNFSDSLTELGSFQALLDNELNFLVSHDDKSSKVDSNFKNFEIYLRKQVPRLESIRREMPFKFGYYVQRLMKVVRDARAKAIEPLFDNTVVPNNKP